VTSRTCRLSAWILALTGGGCLLDACVQPMDMRLVVGSLGIALLLGALHVIVGEEP